MEWTLELVLAFIGTGITIGGVIAGGVKMWYALIRSTSALPDGRFDAFKHVRDGRFVESTGVAELQTLGPEGAQAGGGPQARKVRTPVRHAAQGRSRKHPLHSGCCSLSFC